MLVYYKADIIIILLNVTCSLPYKSWFYYIFKTAVNLYQICDVFLVMSNIFFSGNMWGQQWNNIYDELIPFKGIPGIDVTPVLKHKVNNISSASNYN